MRVRIYTHTQSPDSYGGSDEEASAREEKTRSLIG